MAEQRSELGISGTIVGTVFPLAEGTGLYIHAADRF
jgi:hypothetical protein